MTDGLFYKSDGDFFTMNVAAFNTEDALQKLVEHHPDLLAGGQMNPSDPRRWLLVKREHSVPDSLVSGGRWSVDHLFVDQDAVPTLVEVKRSTDTRVRREVVGQMLDYAANGVRFWPATTLQAAFESTQQAAGSDPATAVAELRGVHSTSLEAFFDEVETNLRAGRIRLVFVADKIPDELRTIVEFLNEQMRQAEVFAIEIKQYRAEGRDDLVIVPTLIGRTAASTDKPGQRESRTYVHYLDIASEEARKLVQLIEELAFDQNLVTTPATISLVLKTQALESLATVYLPWNSLEVLLQPLRNRGWSEQADQFLDELRACTNKRLTEKHPEIPAADVIEHWGQVSDVLKNMAALYRSTP